MAAPVAKTNMLGPKSVCNAIKVVGTIIIVEDHNTCFNFGGTARLPRYAANTRGKLTLRISEGCNLKKTRSSPLCAPLASVPKSVTRSNRIRVIPKK